ncbi:MAG: hypothetical protein JSS66_07650 [Armatimonadetes bacterium]|nr:hypothetical protein [Armatimonadota bacterium]
MSLDWYVGLFAGKLREEVLGEIVRIGRQVPIEHLQTVLMLLRAKQFEVLNSVGGAG